MDFGSFKPSKTAVFGPKCGRPPWPKPAQKRPCLMVFALCPSVYWCQCFYGKACPMPIGYSWVLAMLLVVPDMALIWRCSGKRRGKQIWKNAERSVLWQRSSWKVIMVRNGKMCVTFWWASGHPHLKLSWEHPDGSTCYCLGICKFQTQQPSGIFLWLSCECFKSDHIIRPYFFPMVSHQEFPRSSYPFPPNPLHERTPKARFTALKFQDPQFLAATERDESQSIRERNKQWSVVLGLEDMNTSLVDRECFKLVLWCCFFLWMKGESSTNFILDKKQAVDRVSLKNVGWCFSEWRGKYLVYLPSWKVRYFWGSICRGWTSCWTWIMTPSTYNSLWALKLFPQMESGLSLRSNVSWLIQKLRQAIFFDTNFLSCLEPRFW